MQVGANCNSNSYSEPHVEDAVKMGNGNVSVLLYSDANECRDELDIDLKNKHLVGQTVGSLPSVPDVSSPESVENVTYDDFPRVQKCIDEWWAQVIQCNMPWLARMSVAESSQCYLSQEQVNIIDSWITQNRMIECVSMKVGVGVCYKYTHTSKSSEEDVKRRPEWTQRVVNAIVASQRWMRGNRPEVAAILSQEGGRNYTPHSKAVLTRALMAYGKPYIEDKAILNPQWKNHRIDFQPYPFASYTQELVRLLKKTQVEGDNAIVVNDFCR